MKEVVWGSYLLVGLFVSSTVYVLADSNAQDCVLSTISTQISSLDNPNMTAKPPDVVEKMVDACVSVSSITAALSLGALSFSAAFLGAILSNLLRTRSSATIRAHFEPDSHKLILRFDRPTIVHNPQRMILLYHHADGMDSAMSGSQCGNSGLTLAFNTDIEKSPTRMELVVCSGVMHPVGFPESDVCTDGKPIHVDVDILCAV